MTRYDKLYWTLGIVGCILFGIGDFLLGGVDPAPLTAEFSVLKAGHGLLYNPDRVKWTLLLGAIGVPFLTGGCIHIGEMARDEGAKRRLMLSMLFLPTGWMLIHVMVSSGILTYTLALRQGGEALPLAIAFMKILKPAEVVAALFVGCPLLLLVLYTVQGRLDLPRGALIFTPLLWMGLFSALKFILPATPLSNGIDTFCMNAGMLVFFLYLMTRQVQS